MPLCPDSELAAVAAAVQGDARTGMIRVDALLGRYGEDARLHFLKGALLASNAQYKEAETAFTAAIERSPQYAIARFQLGLLQLTSGNAHAALATWGPLATFPEDHYLARFVRGLQAMIRDELDTAIALLEEGIAANGDLAPLNRDMAMLIAEMRASPPTAPSSDQRSRAAEPTSSTQFLLKVFRPKGRPN